MPLPPRAATVESARASSVGWITRAERPPLWLRTLPVMEHVPEDYGDAPDEHGVAPATYQALERYLPATFRAAPRDRKLDVMREVLVGDEGLSAIRMGRRREVRERIQAVYQPLHREIFTLNPTAFFVPSFLQAIKNNTEDGFRSIMTEPAPGLYVFAMLQPAFCQMLRAEVDHFDQNIVMPVAPTMDKNRIDLSFIGLETMLDNLMKDFLSPVVAVFYPELAASPLDSHHSFVTEFAEGQGEGFGVDDSEVTLNVCITRDFTGGTMYFRGIRCSEHSSSEIDNEFLEMVNYSQTLGQAMLYRGRHRHGALPTTSGARATLEMWCRSSLARRMRYYQTDFTSWCGKCQSES